MYEKLASLLFTAYDGLEHGHIYQKSKHLEKIQWLKSEEIHRLQRMRTKALLVYAYENVRFYHETFKTVGFHPSEFRSLEDMSRVPILKKQKFCQNVETLVATNISRRKQKTWLTSGTTATPIRVSRSNEDIGWGIAAELRGFGWAGYRIGNKMALLWNVRPPRDTSVKFRIGNKLRRCKFLNIRDLSESSLKTFAEQLARFKPDFIRGHAGCLNLFASFLLRNEHFCIRPMAAFTSCETLLPHYRKTIESAFGCRVYDYYSSVEVSHIGAQCGNGDSLHVTEENVLVEINREDETVTPGEEGRVLLTNLHGYAMPFIRYDIGDLGKMLPNDCVCGRKLSLLKVLGRTNEYFVQENGSFVFLKDFQRFFEGLPIMDFEVVQESFNEIVINIVPENEYSSWHTDFIVKNLKYVGQGNIRVELVDSIRPQRSGKITHVRSKIKTKYS